MWQVSEYGCAGVVCGCGVFIGVVGEVQMVIATTYVYIIILKTVTRPSWLSSVILETTQPIRKLWLHMFLIKVQLSLQLISLYNLQEC